MQSLLTIFPVNNFARRENGNQSSDIGIPLYVIISRLISNCLICLCLFAFLGLRCQSNLQVYVCFSCLSTFHHPGYKQQLVTKPKKRPSIETVPIHFVAIIFNLH